MAAGSRWERVKRAGPALRRTLGSGRRGGAERTDLYGGAYFGQGRDPSGDRHGRSGYASYDRVSSNADIAACLLWRHFRARRVLDVGCATGFLVEALRERGLDAEGCDASPFAVEHATAGAQGHVRLGDPVRGLPYPDGAFDLVCALETLEHLAPADVPAALSELRRVSRGLCYATIPSVGANVGGPDGHFDGKVRPERLEHYRACGDRFTGVVPHEDLARDSDGVPVEGHLTIATYTWWTERFAEAGFVRWPEVEERLYADITPVGLERFWNLYVMALPELPPATAQPLEPGRSLPELGLVHPLFEHAAAQAEAQARAEAEA